MSLSPLQVALTLARIAVFALLLAASLHRAQRMGHCNIAHLNDDFTGFMPFPVKITPQGVAAEPLP